jgi:hypothetical protein
MKNKRNKKINNSQLILINRYVPTDSISFSTSYTPIIQKQINYVDELPPFIKNRLNKRNRCKSSSNPLIKRTIKTENIFENYDAFSIKPSLLAKSKMKFSDIFSPKKTKYMTNFPIHYINNIIPCYIYHKTSSFKLIWYKDFSNIDYNSVLTACFEGIIEVAHPFKFIARQGCKELLMAENSHKKILGIIPKLYDYIRIALLDENDETFNDAIDICFLLVLYSGREGFEHTKLILSPLRKRIANVKFTNKIYDVLNLLCKMFGNEAFNLIKQFIPSFFPDTTLYG